MGRVGVMEQESREVGERKRSGEGIKGGGGRRWRGGKEGGKGG